MAKRNSLPTGKPFTYRPIPQQRPPFEVGARLQRRGGGEYIVRESDHDLTILDDVRAIGDNRLAVDMVTDRLWEHLWGGGFRLVPAEARA